ncbi:DUF6211 family protein [Streptomyces sp. 4.24]|uniref:DUF6211 family protein n=1 Tax=Streptomyces tritrimontium TaxID=3406573 RepID=UPI003BB69505
MVDPHQTSEPQPGDLVRLHTDNTAGADHHTPFQIVDLVEDQPGHHVIWHLADHPRHHDWAATIPTTDIAVATRITRGDTRTWTPAP